MSKEEKVYIPEEIFRREVRHFVLLAIRDNDNPVKRVKSVSIAAQKLEVSKKVVKQELRKLEEDGLIVPVGNFWNITLKGEDRLKSTISNDSILDYYG